ncbi:MAG: ATPase [Fibrobacter sp.]|jgi:V/A-type H+-transporting ATPase subunit I|nr:ATPase [Fibrobacter sp.]
MITPMKKLTVICLESSKKETLNTLSAMEVLHVLPLKTPGGDELNRAKRELSHIQKALDSIPEKAPKHKNKVFENIAGEGREVITEIHSLLKRRKEAYSVISSVSYELNRFQPFNEFSPVQIALLDSHGIFVRLYEAEKGKKIEAESGAVVKYFGKNANGHCYAVFSRGEAPAKVSNAHEMTLPPESLRELRVQLKNANEEIAYCESRLQDFMAAKGEVKKEWIQAADDLILSEASSGMIEGASVSMIQGFCPEPRLEEIRAAAQKFGWGLKVEDPSDGDMVPTLLKYRKISKPMQFLYDLIGIAPGYKEVDVSVSFLLFFTLFFAMIVGDAVYGVLFLALTLLARKKWPKADSSGFLFMGIMSVATIIWGIMSANYLGFSPAVLDITTYTVVPEGIRKALLWLRDSDNTKLFCFSIGVTHLTVAHIWNLILKIKEKSLTALAQIGWLCTTWVMFFMAGFMVLGRALPSFTLQLFLVGVALLLLFRVPFRELKENWISIPMLVLDLVTNFVDVISYIRLFAVGMSGLAIAQAFNSILAPLFGSIPGTLAAVLILFMVHALNVALCLMGVAVHAVRLNTLEFSNHIELQWSGQAFSPLAKHKGR